MNIARGLNRLNALKRICLPSQRINIKLVRQSSDHSPSHHNDHHHDHHDHDDGVEWNYRQGCFKEEENKTVKFQGDLLMTVMWWWILWHIFTQPEVLFGCENPATHPELWTDEELGIPPDDE